jgi:hypothetical protein
MGWTRRDMLNGIRVVKGSQAGTGDGWGSSIGAPGSVGRASSDRHAGWTPSRLERDPGGGVVSGQWRS